MNNGEQYALYDTIFGIIKISYSENEITAIIALPIKHCTHPKHIQYEFAHRDHYMQGNTAMFSCRSNKPIKEKTESKHAPIKLSDTAFAQLQEYFQGKRMIFDFPFKLSGTEFQKKVWTTLCDIPYGETRSYKDIAKAVGNPKASRAVGMANNKNPISIVVPCHRVIGADGKLVGYGNGLDMKQKLLELEKKKQY